MKTSPTNEFPEIDWIISNELLEKDIDEREEIYLCSGIDNVGREYIGYAYFICGELEGIRDIEEV